MQAKRSGENVEVGSLRGESTDVFATPDGALEAREFLRPVRARVKGEWKPIDTGLSKVSGGMVATKATTVGLEFSAGGGSAPLVRMMKAGRELELFWPGELPEPELGGATATYHDVLPGVDLRMGAQEDGFTQLLVVKSAAAAASSELSELRLDLAADGMKVRETAAGGLQAVDQGANGVVFEAPEPVMWDSSSASDSGQSVTGARSKTVDVPAGNDVSADGVDEPAAGESGKLASVAVDVPADGRELVLTPDEGLLRGEDTTYPVFIDPQWYSPRASAWTMASEYWASSPQWKFNGESSGGMGYCGWAYCKPNDTKRLFYRIPVSKFAGKSILKAEFVVRNVWSASCAARGVQLWRTKDISSSTTWNSQKAAGFWIDHLKTESFAYGYEGCGAKDAEFDVKSALQQAANGKWSTMTFGLQASSESDADGWKRFSDKAHLRVKYNRPPPQIKMSQLSMAYGGTCKKPDNAARSRSLGTIHADDVTDPDGDNVAVQFQAKWDSGDGKGLIVRWKPSMSGARKSGSGFSIGLPSSVPENKQIHWYARAYDGAQYSPWSYAGDATGCYFYYDLKAPKPPTISSIDYPASDSENPDDPWYDGIGKYGAFSLEANDSQVTKYWYGINVDPSSGNSITTTSGAAKTLKILPPKVGVNTLYVKSFDSAGNVSAPVSYRFRVKAGQPERATWQLDEDPNASESKGSTPPRTVTPHGGVAPNVPGVRGTAVAFNGTDGYASTDLSVVNTSGGFAVSAWVKLSKMPDGAAVIATQPGNQAPGFELYYSKTYDRWAFNQYKADAADAGIARVMAAQPGGVTADKWTHLIGSYSSTQDVLELFVDGKLVGQTAYSTPWEARRGLQIGAASYGGAPSAFFPGAVDDLQLFDKPLAQDEVDKLFTQQTVGDPGRPAVAIFDLDEPADATEISGRGGVLPAKYNGGVTTGAPGVAGKATKFNGTDGYAKIGQSSGPHVNTSRSFSISAWAKLDRKPDGAAIVTAQAGSFAPGFELYYSKAYDRWAVNQYSSDAADATPVRAMQPEGTTARAGEWVHLVGVHDTTANTLTLYVNGTKAGATELSGAFYADQSMYIGADNYGGQVRNYFPGSIDDVRLLDRPVSADEVKQMLKQRPLVKARWKFEEVSDEATTPDDTAEGNTMTLHSGAKAGPGFIDFGGVELDGADDYGATSRMPVDTTGSFTVTAWAQASATPEDEVALVSADGTRISAFAVRYAPDATDPEGLGRWRLSLPAQDSDAAAMSEADNGNFNDVRDWNHLAVVYDGLAKEMRLYVNGNLEEVACADADGDAAPDQGGCTDLVPWAENALSFKAAGALQVGRAKQAGTFGEYFPGLVDDVWAFEGPLTDAQIEKLAASWFDVPTQVPGS
ncbi:LamG domain-containing protein [Streptomyces tauricus]|uniref:LamG domain-containing protein n=1 Tax=Streptomyces tauricus TaxID=68274 RepID=UPI0022437D4B|nr:LamG domain-containing protein [Streptomyces tauricus]MCW8095797.1 DNRLRE domain-containing protein [Streptomyces tauricus]